MPDTNGELFTIFQAGALTAEVLPESLEVPFDCEVVDVTLTAGTGPVGDALIVDVLVDAVSIFGADVGTVAGASNAQQGESGWDDSDTTLLFKPANDGAVQAGMVLLVEAEAVAVTAVATTSFVDNAVGLLQLTVTRGALGTSPAAHDAGTEVTTALPQIADGATASGAEARANLNPGTIQITKGQIITAEVTNVPSGETDTAGSDLTVGISLNRR